MTRIEIEWSENEMIQSFEFNLIGNEEMFESKELTRIKPKKMPQYDMAFYASTAKPDSMTIDADAVVVASAYTVHRYPIDQKLYSQLLVCEQIEISDPN